ncbi:MAG: LrgB family protein [bacterium]|nr:LrgB family protein [bacterium]
MENRVTEIWVYLSQTPLLWLTMTLLVYQAAHWLYRRSGMMQVLNPVLLAVVGLVGILTGTGTSYTTYFEGAQFVHFLLGPATVALAVPLYLNARKLREMAWAIGIGLFLGSLVAVFSAVLIGRALGLSDVILLSLAPKSVTTPIAMGISEKIGGLPALTAVLVIVTGILGAVLGPGFLQRIGVRERSIQGFAIGLASHGIGTARAFLVDDETGAFSGLAMGLNAVVTALLVPIVIHWLI